MYLFVKKEMKKKDIQKMWGMQGTCLMPFLNFFFDDVQYINTCIVCRGKKQKWRGNKINDNFSR